uniref:Uncharacterized protein n=1 Tax=Anguilla anguilla TaxID=7936 RepID=A0A0E9SRK8_ANGAN
MSGRRPKAFLVHLSTVSLELVATNSCNLGRNFPLVSFHSISLTSSV